MSHSPAQSLAAGSQCDVIEKDEQQPQHTQSSVLRSLAAGSVKIHWKEFRFLTKAGLLLFQGAEALPKAMHTHAEEVKVLLSQVSETDRDWSQQGWVLRHTVPCKSWSGSKEKQRSGPTGNYTQSLKRICQGNQTTIPKQENNTEEKLKWTLRSSKSVPSVCVGGLCVCKGFLFPSCRGCGLL